MAMPVRHGYASLPDVNLVFRGHEGVIIITIIIIIIIIIMRRKLWNYLFGVTILVLVFITKNVSGISCQFCNKDSISLGRHTWPCKARITAIAGTIETNNQSLSPNTSFATQNNNNDLITQVENIFDPHEKEDKDHIFRCYCGREFNTFRCLNTHKRSCFVGKTPNMKELFKDTTEEINGTRNG